MHKLTLFLLGLAFCYTGLAQKPDTRLAGPDTTINRLLKEWHAAGCAIAVVEKNKIVLTKGYGFGNFEKRIPVTGNTWQLIQPNGTFRATRKNNWF